MSRGAGRRRRGRELALKVLFELEGSDHDPEEALRYQAVETGAPDDVVAFAETLVLGTVANGDAIDRAVAEASTHWRLDELGKVERAVLRVAAYELLCSDQVPVSVVIDEAIELARAYAGEEAARFVNGVLGRISEDGRLRATTVSHGRG